MPNDILRIKIPNEMVILQFELENGEIENHYISSGEVLGCIKNSFLGGERIKLPFKVIY